MKRLIAFVMMIAVCMSLLIFPALADDDYPEVGFDFEAFEAQRKSMDSRIWRDGNIHLLHLRIWKFIKKKQRQQQMLRDTETK